MADNKFDVWFGGAPVLHTGATGDFSVWKDGAPVLQLQLSLAVEIVGAGGVEVGGAADIAVVVHGPVELGVSGGVRIAPRPPRPPRRRAVVVVGAGGVEVGGAAGLEVWIWEPGNTLRIKRNRLAREAHRARLRQEDEELLLMDVL